MFRPSWEGQACSLGYFAAEWIEENCCYGPGDLQGLPAVVDDEMLDFLVETYRLDPATGRKVFDESVLSRPKGRAKTEMAGWIVCFEAFGDARFDHWSEDEQPVGRPVTSPLIKCLATEESQATAAFSVVAFVIEWGVENRPGVFDGTSGARTYQSATALYLPHGGEIRACSSGAASKDGGKETFVERRVRRARFGVRNPMGRPERQAAADHPAVGGNSVDGFQGEGGGPRSPAGTAARPGPPDRHRSARRGRQPTDLHNAGDNRSGETSTPTGDGRG